MCQLGWQRRKMPQRRYVQNSSECKPRRLTIEHSLVKTMIGVFNRCLDVAKRRALPLVARFDSSTQKALEMNSQVLF